MGEHIDLSESKYNPELGADIEAAVLIKWTNQRYHDENLRSMFNGDWDEKEDISRSNVGRHRQQYYPGLLTVFNLSVDYLDESNADMVKNELQPTDIHFDEAAIYLAAANKIHKRKKLGSADEQVISNEWFARLHSVDVNEDKDILTVSSAFDQVFIVDCDGNIKTNIDIWSYGKNLNKFGHRLLKSQGQHSSHITVNPAIENLKYFNPEPDRINVIADPTVYKGLGLPTYLTPTFVNHVSFDKNNNTILATTLNTGECLVINPEDETLHTVLSNLHKPHGLRNFNHGYLVTNSGNEEIIILDPEFNSSRIYSTASFNDRKTGLEKAFWLQNTIQIADDLLITISAPRQKVTLINTTSHEYRDIPFDFDWGIQTIKTIGTKF